MLAPFLRHTHTSAESSSTAQSHMKNTTRTNLGASSITIFNYSYCCSRHCSFYKIKVWDNTASSKSVNMTFPEAFVTPCHIFVIPAVFQNFSLSLCLLWQSMVSAFFFLVFLLLEIYFYFYPKGRIIDREFFHPLIHSPKWPQHTEQEAASFRSPT